MEENNITQTPNPNPLTTVTPLSKTLALILFVALPFLGFYLGMRYQNSITVPAPTPGVSSTTVNRPPNSFVNLNQLQAPPTPTPNIETTNWKTYTNTDFQLSLRYPPDWKIEMWPKTKSEPDVYLAVLDLQVLQHELPLPPLQIVISNRSYDEEVGFEINDTSKAGPIQIANKNGIKSRYQYGPTGWYGYKIIIPLKSTAIIFRVNRDYEITINQILSTFRFD